MSLWTINFAKISIYLEIHRQASLPVRIFIRPGTNYFRDSREIGLKL